MSVQAFEDPTAHEASALADRIVEASVGTLELWSLWLGTELGLYAALAAEGGANAPALARTAHIAPRYAREWLEQQAVAGILEVDDADRPADERHYRLPEAYASVLLDQESGLHVAPLARMLRAVAGALPQVAAAYRSGGGVAYGAFGSDMAHGQGAMNRPLLMNEFAQEWIPAVGDLDAELRRPGARIADLGCGLGWSTIALARAYPEAEVIGIDLDAHSIEVARNNARNQGVEVRFECQDAGIVAGDEGFDLAVIFEALHDMARPVDTLEALRRILKPGGSVLVIDERVEERFTAPGNLTERFMYGWSVSHCLPAGMDHPDPEPIGTAARPCEIERVAREAQFSRCEQQPIEHEFFRVYRLRP